jgi:hypothetical protein
MAAPNPNIEDLKKQIEDLKKVYKQLTGKPVTIVDASTIRGIQDAQDAIRVLTDAIDTASERASRFGDGFASVQQDLQAIVGELQKSNNAQNLATKALKGTQDIAQKLKYDQQDISRLSLKELEQYKEKLKQQQSEAKFQAEILAREKGIVDINRVNLRFRRDLTDSERSILEGLKAGLPVYEDINTLLEGRIKKEKDINSLMGIGGAAVEGIDKALEEIGFGGLSKALGLEEVKERMKEVAEEIQEAGHDTDSFANKFKVLKAGISEAGNNLISTLKDPLTATLFIVTELVEALKDVDAGAGKMAKNFGVSFHEALHLKGEMNSIAGSTSDVNVTTGKLVESFTTLNNAFGTFASLSEESLVTFTKLTKQAGLSNEAAVALTKTSLLNNKTVEDTTAEYLGQVEAFKAQTGSAINTRLVLEDIGKISAATALTLGNTPDALAEAAVTARSLGMSIEQVNQAASQLLNFESSITSELEAELLTGKDLNLEEARRAALNGDIATLSKEISKNIGTAADFSKMNVIQQEALAKSVGMSRDELAKTLQDQAVLNKLKGKEGETAKERFDNLVKEVGLEKAKKELGDEALANQFAGQNVAERFGATMDKVKEIFISLAEPLLPVLEIFTDIFKIVGPIVGLIGKMVHYAAELGKPLLMVYGVYKGIQAAQSASLVISRSASIIEAGKLTLLQQQLATEGELSLLDKITLGLAQAKLFIFNQQYRTKVLEATQEKIIGGLTRISLVIQEAYQAVKLRGLATTARDIAMQTALKAKQLGGFLVDVGKFAIRSAIAVAGIPIVGPILAIGAIAAAIAGGMALYNKFKGNDVVSGGYGKRTLMAPEGAIALNDKDTVIAGTDLGGKNKSKNNTGEASSQTNTASSIDITPLIDRMAAVEGLLSQILQKETNIYMDSTKVGTGFAMSTSKIQ